MAATQTVHQLASSYNSGPQATVRITATHGVVTLFGYGITVQVDRGHLVVKDGIGTDRREARLSRVGHGLRRLVVIGSDGFVSLAALRWLADQGASFAMLDRDGSVLATTGPVRPSDARLRRAQALAHQSGVAVQIARELVDQKLAGQEQLARDRLNDSFAAKQIASARGELTKAETIPAIRLLESQAAHAYWSAWRTIPVLFPRNDLQRVPEHWRTFGTRQSPLTGSPRLAVNPPNAILNYLYAILESEARLAAAALGLDPGIGILHVDTDSRDSLACDLMEPVRPQVDAYVLDWISHQPLRREWFFEKRDGNCRLMGSFAVRLAETAPAWGRAVAPVAEWVARTLWSRKSRASGQFIPPTRLTEDHRRQARGRPSGLPVEHRPKLPVVCRVCGALIKTGQRYCASCAAKVSKDALVKAARRGRVAAHSKEAEARRAETQRRQHAARQAWRPSDLPGWLNEEIYREKIQPRLVGVAVTAISRALRVSEPYAAEIRAGKRVPHPRHWEKLAQVAGLSPDV
jgi:CRISPR-associated protein Cas1